MVVSVVPTDPASESTSQSTTMSSSYQSRSSLKSYRSKQHGRIYTVADSRSPSSSRTSSTCVSGTTRQSRYDQQYTRPRYTMSADRDLPQEVMSGERLMQASIQSRGRYPLYVDEDIDTRRSSRFGYSLDRYSNPAARVDRDAYEHIRHDLRQAKSSRFLNSMRPSAIKRTVEEVYDTRSSVARAYGVPSKASSIRSSSYEDARYRSAPRTSRSASLTRFGDLDLDYEPIRRPKRSSSVSRYENRVDENWEALYPRKTYGELRSEYDVRTNNVQVDRDLLNYKDLSATVVDQSGNFSPDDIRVRTLPSGKKAMTFTKFRQSGSGDKVEANNALQRVIQKTQFMEKSMSSLEEFVRRNRSLFPEDTRIYQQYTYFLLNEQQLREIGEPPDAQIYGVTIREKLVVPYGTDVTSLLGRYFKKSEVEVEYDGQRQRRGRQITTQSEDEVDYLTLQDNIRRKVEEEWEIKRQSRAAGLADYQVKTALRHRDQRDTYDHLHPHVTPTYIRTIYDGAGARYDDIYRRTRPGYEPATPSEQEPKRSTKPKKRLDATPAFTTRLGSKRCMEQQTIRFNCAVSGLPLPNFTWFHGNKIITDGGRYRITNDFGFLTLEISNVTKDDAGLYTVKATNVEGEVACSASLDVVGVDAEGDKDDGMRKPYFLVEPFNVWAEVGAKVVIEAQAKGKPAPTFRWLRDNIPIEESDRCKVVSDENGNTKLVIREAQIADSGLYFCIAENKAGKAKCAATFRVVDKGQEKPPMREREPVPSVPDLPERHQFPQAGRPWFVQLPPQEITLREGDPLTIKCVIDGDPKPVVTWFKGVRELTYSKRHRILCEGQNHYLLQIPSTLQTDPGQYIVSAENSNGRCQSTIWVNILPKDADIDEDTILRTLRLQLPDLEYDIEKTTEFAKTPPKFIKKLPLETEVSSGSSFEFRCAVQDETPIEEIRTTIDRKVMEGDYKLIETTHNLSKGTKQVEEIPLGIRVDAAPKILAPMSDVSVNIGGRVRLTLKVNMKATVVWSKDGKTIEDGGRFKVITEGKTLILEVADVTEADAGAYTVTISNDKGSDSATCSMNVLGDIVTTDQVKAVVESQVEQVFQDAMQQVEAKFTDVSTEDFQDEVTINIAESAEAESAAATAEAEETIEAQITLTSVVEAKSEVTTEEAVVEETLRIEVTPAEEVPEEGALAEAEAPVKAATKEEAPVESATMEEGPVEAAPKVEAPVEAAPKVEAPVEAAPKTEAPVEAAPRKDAPVEAAPKTEAPVEAAPRKDAPVEAAPKEEAPVEAAPRKDAPVEAAPKKEAPVEAAPKEEAPVEYAPKEETPVESAPKEEAPVESAPKEETPVEAAPKGQAPAAPAPTEEEKEGYKKIDEEETTTEAKKTEKKEESEASESTEATTESSDATSSAAVPAKDDKDAGDTEPLIEEEKPVEVAPVEEKPVEEKPAGEKPAEVTATEEKPVEEKPAKVAPTEEKPAEVAPTEEKPVEEKPTEVAPAEEKPAEVAPAEEKPAEQKPTEEKPVEAAPAEVKPSEEEKPKVEVQESSVSESVSESVTETTSKTEPSKPEEKPAPEIAPVEEKSVEAEVIKKAHSPPIMAAPAEEKPVESDEEEPVPAEPEEPEKPAADIKAVDEEPIEADLVKKVEEKPEEKPTEVAPAVEKPTEVAPAEEKPTEGAPAEEKPTEGAPAEEKPTEGAPAEEKPVESDKKKKGPAICEPKPVKPEPVRPVKKKPAEDKPDTKEAESEPSSVSESASTSESASKTESVSKTESEKPKEVTIVTTTEAERSVEAKVEETVEASAMITVEETAEAKVEEAVEASAMITVEESAEVKVEESIQVSAEVSIDVASAEAEVKAEDVADAAATISITEATVEESAEVSIEQSVEAKVEETVEASAMITVEETAEAKVEEAVEASAVITVEESAEVKVEESIQVSAEVSIDVTSAEAEVKAEDVADAAATISVTEATVEESAEVSIEQSVEAKVEETVEASAMITVEETAEAKVEEAVEASAMFTVEESAEAKVEESIQVSAEVSIDVASAEAEVKAEDVADAAATISITEATVEESADVSIEVASTEVTEKTVEVTTESVTETTSKTSTSEVTTSEVSAEKPAEEKPTEEKAPVEQKPVEEKVEAPVEEKPAKEKPAEEKPAKEEPSESSEAESSTAASSTAASSTAASTTEATTSKAEKLEETAEATIEVQETADAEAKIVVQETVEAEAKIEVQETEEAEANIQIQETVEAEAMIEVQETVEAEAKIVVQETAEAEAEFRVQETAEAEAEFRVEETAETAAEATLQVEETAEAEIRVEKFVEEKVEVEETVEVQEGAAAEEKVKVEIKIEKKKKKVKVDTEEGEVDTMDEVSENLESYASDVEVVEGGEELDESESTVSAETSSSSTESKSTETKSADIAGTRVSFVHTAKAEEVVVETFDEATARIGGDQVDSQEVMAAFQAAEAEIRSSQARSEEEKVEVTINVTTNTETIEMKSIDEAKTKVKEVGGKIVIKKFIIRLDGCKEELMEAELVDGDEDFEVGRLIMLGPGENTEEALERVRSDVFNVVGVQRIVIRRVIVIRGDEPEDDIIAHLKSEGVDENALASLRQEIAKVRVRTVVRRIIITGEGFDEDLLEQLRMKLVEAGGTGKVTVSKLVLSVDDSDNDIKAKLKAESLDDQQTLIKMKAELEKAKANNLTVVMKIVIQGEGLDDAAFTRIKLVIATFGGEKETRVTTRKFVVTGEETDEELTKRMMEEGLDEATMEKIRADLAYARLQSHLVRRVVIHGDGVDDDSFEKLKLRLSAVQGQGNVTVRKLVLKVDEPEENIRNTLKNENFDDARIAKMLQELAEAKGEGKTMIMKIIILGEGVKDEDFERIKEELANFGNEVEARVHRTLTRRIIIHGEGMDDEGIEKLRSALVNAAGSGSITVTKLVLNVADSEDDTVNKIKAEGLDDNTVAKMKAELEEAKEDGEDRLLKIIIQGQDLDDAAFERIKTEIRSFGGESEGAVVVRKLVVRGGHGMDQETLDQIRAQLAEGCSSGRILIKRVVREDAGDSDEGEEEEIEVRRVTEVKEVVVKEVEGQQKEEIKQYTVDKSADTLSKEMLEGDFDSKEVVKKVNVVKETFTGEQEGVITKTTRIITTTISTAPDGSIRKETKTEVHTETQDAGDWTEDSDEDSEMETETESRTESKKGGD